MGKIRTGKSPHRCQARKFVLSSWGTETFGDGPEVSVMFWNGSTTNEEFHRITCSPDEARKWAAALIEAAAKTEQALVENAARAAK